MRTGAQHAPGVDPVAPLVDATRLLDALALGDRIGPYALRAVLGRGGMGVVYRAERVDGQVGGEVAIKLLPRDRLDEEG